jgi:histidinol-phosphate aminotransferase
MLGLLTSNRSALMSVSRRNFIASLGVGGAGVLALPLVTSRGRESLYAFQQVQGTSGTAARRADRLMASRAGMIRIDSNENPNGPGAGVYDAIKGALGTSNRYPTQSEDDLIDAIARSHGVKPENVLLGCGSGELLRASVQAFTSADRPLVSPVPTFESSAGFARFIGTKVIEPGLDASLKFDLQAMSDAARGAGLVYFCNPNNPTSTVHTKAEVTSYIADVNKRSPETTILVDEAYHEYVAEPGYATAVPIAIANPRVFVLRTFSKVFGMAGLRVGYAIGQKATLDKMRPWMLGSNVNALALAAATMTIGDTQHIAAEVKRNAEAREYTKKFFTDAGFTVAGAEGNFLMVNVKRDVRALKAELIKKNVAVGRPFPPLNTHLRISIGTMPEMKKALDVLHSTLV